MRVIKGNRGKIYIEVEHHERPSLFLVLGAAWAEQYKYPEVKARVPHAWDDVQRLLDQLRRMLT